MLGHKRIPSREGGVEIVVTELAARMAAMGHEVTCYNRSGHHVSGKEFDGKKMAEYKGVHLKYVPTINGKGLAAVSSSFFAALAGALRKYDVVHIHAEGPAAMCWLPKLFGKRVVVTVHGLDWKREKWARGFGTRYIHFGERCMVRYADRIIVLNEDTKKYFQDTYGRETTVIPNGVERPVRRDAGLIREKYGLSSPYLLALSRLVPEKRTDLLIEAFRQVKTEKKLVIAGGSSDTDEYMNKLKNMAAGDDRIIREMSLQKPLVAANLSVSDRDVCAVAFDFFGFSDQQHRVAVGKPAFKFLMCQHQIMPFVVKVLLPRLSRR